MTSKVNPYDVYSTYMSIKLHFERGAYDAFRYHFKGPRIKPATFAKSRDKYTYEKIALKYPKKEDLIDYLLANVLAGRSWIREYSDEDYLAWLGKVQSLSYRFNTDMQKAADYCENHDLNFDDLLMSNNRGVIPIFTLLKKEIVSEESVIVLDVLTEFLNRINKNLPDDPLEILAFTIYRLRQYRPFLLARINKSAARNTILNLFTNVVK